MGKIRIITDTASDMTTVQAEELGVIRVPLSIRFGDDEMPMDTEAVSYTHLNQETKTKVAEKDRGYIGISGVDVTPDSAKMYNMPTGVYISEVQKNGGADEAGLTKGMVITGINGSSVDGMTALQEQLQYYEKGETVTLTVQTPTKAGEYEESQVEVTLGSRAK